jgi:hypothetical protein
MEVDNKGLARDRNINAMWQNNERYS